MSIDLVDVPVEVTMVNGSRWIVYIRLGRPAGFAEAVRWIREDIEARRTRPADDPDGVQRRLAQVNMAYVVSWCEPEQPEGSDR